MAQVTLDGRWKTVREEEPVTLVEFPGGLHQTWSLSGRAPIKFDVGPFLVLQGTDSLFYPSDPCRPPEKGVPYFFTEESETVVPGMI